MSKLTFHSYSGKLLLLSSLVLSTSIPSRTLHGHHAPCSRFSDLLFSFRSCVGAQRRVVLGTPDIIVRTGITKIEYPDGSVYEGEVNERKRSSSSSPVSLRR